MAKYIGPKHKLARREGVNIIDKTSKSLQRRLTVLPGVHGKARRKKPSEFGMQLRSKQKAKAVYGILEKQFKNLMKNVSNKKGNTAELLIVALETRLDNIVYRLHFAKTRFQSRQFVSHGHVRVNGKKINIPSYSVKVGDVIELSSKIQNYPEIAELLKAENPTVPFVEKKAAVGKLISMPKIGDLEVLFDTQLIIEYYSR